MSEIENRKHTAAAEPVVGEFPERTTADFSPASISANCRLVKEPPFSLKEKVASFPTVFSREYPKPVVFGLFQLDPELSVHTPSSQRVSEIQLDVGTRSAP